MRNSQLGTWPRFSWLVNALVYAVEMYVGLATTATSSVLPALPPSIVSADRISWAMSGQSVVHTGSRKVSSTTLPRRLARETCRPSWLVSVKPGAGVSSCPLVPAMACAVIGSAFLLTEANAIGAAPTRMTPSAPTPATTPHRRPGERPQQPRAPARARGRAPARPRERR